MIQAKGTAKNTKSRQRSLSTITLTIHAKRPVQLHNCTVHDRCYSPTTADIPDLMGDDQTSNQASA